MVDQYPHTANVTYSPAASKATNGDKTPGDPIEVPEFDCRAEPSSGSGMIMSADGKAINFGWIVYCEVGTPKLPVGAKIIVKDKDGNQMCSDEVLRFSKGMFNSRIWL